MIFLVCTCVQEANILFSNIHIWSKTRRVKSYFCQAQDEHWTSFIVNISLVPERIDHSLTHKAAQSQAETWCTLSYRIHEKLYYRVKNKPGRHCSAAKHPETWVASERGRKAMGKSETGNQQSHEKGIAAIWGRGTQTRSHTRWRDRQVWITGL